MWIWAREEWIWIQVKFADEAQTTVPDSKLYSTNDVKKVATTFFVFCEFTTVFARKSFSRPRPDFTPQTVLIHLKKAPDGMIVPQSEFGIYSTNSSKKSSWWNDCSSTRDRKQFKTSRSGVYFVPETGRLVAKFPATMTICTPRATAFVRKTDENFTNWSKKFEPAAEGRRIFFNVQLSFPNFWHRKMAVGSQQWPGTNVAEVAHSPRQRHSVTNLSVHLIEDSEDSKTHALCVKWSK